MDVRGRERMWIATFAALVTVVGACGSDADDAAREDADYCTEIDGLMSVLDDGGPVSDYDAALVRVADAGPPDHADTWALLLTLSQEPFDYENFNPAVDSLDDIFDDLTTTCSGVDPMIVDDDGRVRRFPPG